VQAAQVGGVGGVQLAQQPVVMLHQVAGDVDGQGAQLRGEFVAAGHLRQAAGAGGDQLAADRDLSVGGGAVAGLPVQFGGLQQEIAAGQVRGEGIEGADADQALRDRQGRPGALPQVLQTDVGPAGRHAGDLLLADALDRREGQPHAPALLGLFDAVLGAGVVNVDVQHGHAVAAGVGDDDPARPHARIVLQQSRVQGGGVMGLQEGGLEGGDGEGDRMRAAEAVRAEGGDGLPHLIERLLAVAALAGRATEPLLHPRQPVWVGQGAAGNVAGGPVAAGHPERGWR
jgi:hypothetical protein